MWTIPLNGSFPSSRRESFFQGHPSVDLTLVTTFCCSPDCSSNLHSEHIHAVTKPFSVPFPIRSTNKSRSEPVPFPARTHFLSGWPSRKWSENWMNEMRKAGIHVRATRRLWYFPNPPRNGRTTVSTCESRLCGSDCDTFPFSAGASSRSSRTASIARRFQGLCLKITRTHTERSLKSEQNPVWIRALIIQLMRKGPHKVFVEPGGHSAIAGL